MYDSIVLLLHDRHVASEWNLGIIQQRVIRLNLFPNSLHDVVKKKRNKLKWGSIKITSAHKKCHIGKIVNHVVGMKKWEENIANIQVFKNTY